MTKTFQDKLNKFLSKSDKAVLTTYVSNPDIAKAWFEYFYGVKK